MYSSTPITGLCLSSKTPYPDLKYREIKGLVIKSCLDIVYPVIKALVIEAYCMHDSMHDSIQYPDLKNLDIESFGY